MIDDATREAEYMIELESLDLAPALGVEERNAAPILAVCEMERERAAARFSAVKHKVSAYAGLSLAELCREHLAAPNESTRATILSTPLTTRAEALATFSVIEPIARIRSLRRDC